MLIQLILIFRHFVTTPLTEKIKTSLGKSCVLTKLFITQHVREQDVGVAKNRLLRLWSGEKETNADCL